MCTIFWRRLVCLQSVQGAGIPQARGALLRSTIQRSRGRSPRASWTRQGNGYQCVTCQTFHAHLLPGISDFVPRYIHSRNAIRLWRLGGSVVDTHSLTACTTKSIAKDSCFLKHGTRWNQINHSYIWPICRGTLSCNPTESLRGTVPCPSEDSQ